MKSKKALSGIIGTMLLVGLAIVLIGIVWGVINNIVGDQINSAESCFNNYGKVNIIDKYTCYNSTGPKLQFSIEIKDIDVDQVVISIAGQGSTKSLTISNASGIVSGVTSYSSGSSVINLPGRNSGLTYVYDLTTGGFTSSPDSITISPVINGEQCEVSDSLNSIENC